MIIVWCTLIDSEEISVITKICDTCRWSVYKFKLQLDENIHCILWYILCGS